VGPVIAPAFVSVLGASGAAWAAGLKPYSPYLLVGSLLLLGVGFWGAYRGPANCDSGVCARSPRPVRVVLWIAASLWLAAAAVNVVVRVTA
jgi:mercuric ion transport protein